MHIHFKKQVLTKVFSQELISLDYLDSNLEWKNPDEGLKNILKALLEGGKKEESLLEMWDREKTPLFYFLIERLKQKGWLSYTLYDHDLAFCTLSPFKGCSFQFKAWKNKKEPFQLSRFAYMRSDREILMCETPLAPVCLEMHHPQAASILAALSKPATLESLNATFPSLSCLESFITLLFGASFIETQDPVLDTWEFHDLLFHSRSRRGRRPEEGFGATFRFLDKKPPLAAIKPISEETKWHSLYAPDMKNIYQKDPPFSEVLEKRSSERDSGTRALDSKEIGEFLFRVGRIKGEKKAQNYEATARSYPGGGACYELELYPLINRCEGLDRGLYYYHPQKHALTLISGWNLDLDHILIGAMKATARIEKPQAAFLISSRFGRLSWKYQAMAYATTLKDTGVLMQTMYLVATAMNLAPCAIGGGNSDLFSKVAKTNYYEETTVGEFLLGTKNN